MSWQEISLNLSTNKLVQDKINKQNARLIESIKNNDAKEFFDSIESGADVNCIINNENPLIVAMNYNNLDLFNLIIKLDANVNIKINDYTIIWQSLWENKIDFFKPLAHYINKNDKEKKTGKTILMEAVTYSNLEAVKALIESGFNINNKDNMGNTALHYVLSKNNYSNDDREIIKLLIEAGANVLSENIYGNKPEDLIKDKVLVFDEEENKQTNKNVKKPTKGNKYKGKHKKYVPK